MTTKIYTNEDGSPITKEYNGSWTVIDHESSDGNDYSMCIWNTYDQAVEEMMHEYGVEDEGQFTEEDYLKAWEWTLDAYADSGVEIIGRKQD